VLCWHSVRERVAQDDAYSISRAAFVEQLEYLKTHGYQPVSVPQVLQAAKGDSRLPDKAVLLSFDDAYRSFYEFVFPLLTRLGYPSMLAVVGSWIENGPPEDLAEPLMTWKQIAAVSRSPLVEVATHSYNLHRSVRYNRIGNVGAVISVREFLPDKGRYETEDEYRQKLALDFSRQKNLFQRRLGSSPRVMVWPYGRYNAISIAVARESGCLLAFNLAGGWARLHQSDQLNRILVKNGPIEDFIRQVELPEPAPDPIRAVQVDLDLIYDPSSPQQTDKNLGLLIERLTSLGIDTVFLQAFCDVEGTGNIRSVYFNNRVLPVEADIFSHAVHQMIIRDLHVFAWMPTLSIVFPDTAFNQHYRVREYAQGGVRPSESWYQRLTPFSPEVREKVRTLYEDLAAGSQIEGVLFQDDAYLTDHEDVHPLALKAFGKALGHPVSIADLSTDPELQARWIDFKTRALTQYLENLKDGVRKFRPLAAFARNLYANVLVNPASQAWFAQDYADFLKAYDYVVVMAYPQMETAKKPLPWLQDLAAKALALPQAENKTIFKLQTYDWNTRTWIEGDLLLREMRTALAGGIRHLAYYPDNLWENEPAVNVVRLEMSTRSMPRVK
jgi:poly-beta-1,6-N-acetyl-D-glucosamine N-deacetylase